jgi:mediator of RNA polymerase II transcription subunit 31
MGLRFEQDLEFVQLLCNPDYIRWLSQEGYFASEEFKGHLRYLRYWKRPEYSRLLIYPQCLVVLEYLTRDDADRLVNDESFMTALGSQQYYIWLDRGRG